MNAKIFLKVQEREIEEPKSSQIYDSILVILAILIEVGVLILLYYIVSSSLENTYDSLFSQRYAQGAIKAENEFDIVPRGEQVYAPFEECDLSELAKEGILYQYSDSEMELYIVIRSRNNNSIVAHGEQYHDGGHLVDSSFDESFSYNADLGKFVNKSCTLCITELDSFQIVIEDRRDTVCLPFSGTLRRLSN